MLAEPLTPLVSCIMPTYNRRRFVLQAIAYFMRQNYSRKELVILDDGSDKIEDLLPDIPEIKYLSLPSKRTVGEKRNLAVEASRGEIILHWDDDDWMHPHRISYQVENLLRENAEVSGTSKVLFYQVRNGKLWLYEYPHPQAWLCGGSLCYQKTFWERKKFAPLPIGEDTKFIWTEPKGKMLALADFKFYVAMIHSHNTCAKSLSHPWWQLWQGESAQVLMNEDMQFYAQLSLDMERTVRT